MKRMLVGLLLGAGCLYFFVQEMNWVETQVILKNLRLPWVVAAIFLLVFEFVIRGIRWKIILRPLTESISLSTLIQAQMIGGTANTLLPLRLGEVIKPTLVSSKSTVSFITIAATAVMERVYDLLGMVSVLIFMVLFLQPDINPAPDQQILVDKLQLYGGIIGLIATLSMAIFFTLATKREEARPIFVWITNIAPKPIQDFFLRLFDGFIQGLGNSTDTKGLWQAGTWSVIMWLNGALAIYCLFQAFGLSLPFGAACFVGVAIALGVALPQAPGFVGVFHVAIENTLLLWGQDPQVAKSFALIFWMVSFVPVTLLGLIMATRWDIDWQEIIARRSDDESTPPTPALGPKG